MQAKAIPQVQTPSRTDNQLQQNIIQGVSPLLKNPLAVVNIVQAALQNGSNTINHGLNETPSGFIVVSSDGIAAIYGNQFNSSSATIVSNAAVNCSLLFF